MFNIVRTTAHNKYFQSLIDELDTDLSNRYSFKQENFKALNKIDGLAKVVVAFKDYEAVGCGCYRQTEESEVVEVKRMYVLPSTRGLGVAKLILKELECWAKEDGFSKVKLETGIKQPEAISLYSKLGYNRIENYGAYKHIPESVCMAKDLK